MDEHGHDELCHRRDAAYDPSEDWDDLMHAASPLALVPQGGVGTVLHPSNPQLAYFFCSSMYSIVNIVPQILVVGPRPIIEDWPSLAEANFDDVDAILPNPEDTQQMYFFSGATFDYIIGGVAEISDWKSLKEAGFMTVDAVLPVCGNKNQVYFFSDDFFILVEFEPGKYDHLVTQRKRIAEEWQSLKAAEFNTVDAILPVPGKPNQAFFFSYERYMIVDVGFGPGQDRIESGPELVSKGWPSLHKADFW
ncbi:hypothetical protein C0995_014876 [Termitomyces sp. Mi166|nr:hypothetical protein C0995_014876 [Termitomyces sp. Mi166\